MKRIPGILILLIMMVLLCLSCAASAADEPLPVPEEVDALLMRNYGQYIIHDSACTCIDPDSKEAEDSDWLYAFLIQHGDKYALSVVVKTDGQYYLAVSNPTVLANGILPGHLLLDIVAEPKNLDEMVMKARLTYRYIIGKTEFDITADSVWGSWAWTINNVIYDDGDHQYTLKWMPDMLLIRAPEYLEKCNEWCVPLMKQFASSELSSFSLEELLKHLHYDNYSSYIIENTALYILDGKKATASETIAADEYVWCLFSVDVWKVVENDQNDTGFVQSSITAPQVFGRSDECEIIIPDEAYQRYSPEEIQSAVDALKKYNDSTAGRILQRIEYDDLLCSKDYWDGLDGVDRYEKIIAFYTDFDFIDDRYALGFEDGCAGGWEMYLGRNGNGPWEVFNQGY